MDKNIYFLKKGLVITVLTLLLNACAMGPIYKPAPEAPEGFALLYLMRGDVYYGGGYPTSFKINDVKIVDLYNFGYSWIHLKPGEYDIRAGSGRKKLTVEAGKTYYLEYHQENIQMPSGRVNTSVALTLFDQKDIQNQLSESRYKEADTLEKGEKSSRRYFKNVELDNGAKIRFVRKSSYRRIYPNFSAGLYDNYEECVDGYQAFEKIHLAGEYFTLPGDQPVSLSTYLSDDIPDMSLTCRNIFTFKPLAGKSYTISVDIEKTSTQSRKDFCIVQVVDDESQEKIDVLSRSLPIQWTGYSPKCDASDLEEVEQWKNHSKVKFNCRIKFNGKWHNC